MISEPRESTPSAATSASTRGAPRSCAWSPVSTRPSTRSGSPTGRGSSSTACALAGAQKATGVAGRLACAESMAALKDLLNGLGHEDLRLEGSSMGADVRSGYVLNAGIASVEQCDALLL